MEAIIGAVLGSLIDWVKSKGWREDGVRTCVGCGHHVQHFRKHVGFIIGGHDQISCGCRLARHAREEHHQNVAGMCGCEWTRDV